MGNVGDPPVLLVMGLGAQLVLWRDGFCERLVDQGYRVIRYDNRDVGLSTQAARPAGRRRAGARTWCAPSSVCRASRCTRLEHMADDAAALLDHLGIDRAHIVGASMGGMIAQIFAARHAQRTAALGIIFSSNNSALLPPPAPKALLSLIKGPPPDSPREVDRRELGAGQPKIIGSPGYPKSEEQLRAEAIESYERSHYPQGIGRHFGAVLGSGSLKRYDTADQRADRRNPRPRRQIDAPRRAAGRSPRRSRTRAWCCSTGWPTICPKRCGTTSSANSRRRSPQFAELGSNGDSSGHDRASPIAAENQRYRRQPLRAPLAGAVVTTPDSTGSEAVYA